MENLNNTVEKQSATVDHKPRSQRKRRQFDRYLIDPDQKISGLTTNKNSIDSVPCHLLDIASQNCTILSSQPLDPGEDIRIELRIVDNLINIQGKVKTISMLKDGTIRCGVQFNQPINPDKILQKKKHQSRRTKVDIYQTAKRFSKRLGTWKTAEFYHYHRKDAQTDAKMVDFTSNDYLNLSKNKKIKEVAKDALLKFGLGTAGPSIFAGDYDFHTKLSETMASIKNMESCLLCPSGFTANSGIFTGLINIPGTLIFLDEKDHASIYHGAMASKGKIKVFRHNDVDHLERLMSQYERTSPKVICVDGVYSMDGDLAPLDKLYALAKEYGASMWVDDAHSFGIFGEDGSGIESHFGLRGKMDIVTGSLSKTLGGLGGYVCATKAVTDYLDHLGREFVYTTTLPSAICSGLIEGLKIITEESSEARKILWRNTRSFKTLLLDHDFPLGPTESPIFPIIFGHETVTQQFAQELYKAGININSVTRPAVRRNESRLRITIRADHTPEQIELTIRTMCRVREKLLKAGVEKKYLFGSLQQQANKS